jgi:hypothetical protein
MQSWIAWLTGRPGDLERISELPPEDLGAGELEKAEEVLGLPLPSSDKASLSK